METMFFKILKKILLKRKNIILPGIGQFKLSYQQALQRGNKIYPPSYKFEFNSNISYNNDEIIEDIYDSIDGSYDTARDYLQNSIKEFKTELEKNGTLKIEGFGLFSKNEKNIEFKPDEDLLNINNLRNYPPIELISKIEKEETQVNTINKQEPKILKVSHQDKKQKPKKSVKAFLVLSLSISAIAIAFSIYYFFFYLQPESFEQTTHYRKAENEIDMIIDSARIKKNALSPVKRNTIPDRYSSCTSFKLIAGSFRTKRNAEELKLKLENKNYSPFIYSDENDLYRVVLKEYSVRDSAIIEFKRVKEKEGEGFVWLLSE